MRPRRIRSSYARSRARLYLRENGLDAPPINVIELIEQYGKIKWDKDAGNGFTIYYEKLNVYCVFIDPDTIQGRITWTMCHELAHIVLGHFLEYDMDNLLPREERILNRECDIFVRDLLMPEQWMLKHYEPPLTVPQIGKLKDRFDVSWEAIIYRFNELGICENVEIDQLFSEWNSQRENEIVYINYAPVEEYEKPDALKGVNCCLSNGARGVMKLSGPIKIPGIDDNNRFLECPVCGNDVFSHNASFCKICGYYLFNDCLNSPYDPRTAHEECGRANVSNALFCEHCGSRTMLYELFEKTGYSEEAMKDVAVGKDSEDSSF